MRAGGKNLPLIFWAQYNQKVYCLSQQITYLKLQLMLYILGAMLLSYNSTAYTGNMNDLKTTCLQKLSNSASNMPTGTPAGSWALVLQHSDAYVVQLIILRDGSQICSRSLQSGTWGTWKAIVFS